jgi:hypothetical protein
VARLYYRGLIQRAAYLIGYCDSSKSGYRFLLSPSLPLVFSFIIRRYAEAQSKVIPRDSFSLELRDRRRLNRRAAFIARYAPRAGAFLDLSYGAPRPVA